MIRATQLEVRAGTVTLLRGIDLTVAPGELVMVLGPNGAGKSTLLQTLSGVLKPTHGLVELCGKPLLQYSLRARAQMLGYLQQHNELSADFTVSEVVGLGRYAYAYQDSTAEAQQAVERALDRLALKSFAQRRYQTLSGGEQQRVHLARVLAQIDHPDINQSRFLLLDEHVAHLDLAHQHRVFQLLRSLLKEGVGMVAVVHDLNVALAYADRVILLKKGHQVAAGKSLEVLNAEQVREVFEVDVTWALDSQGKKWLVPSR